MTCSLWMTLAKRPSSTENCRGYSSTLWALQETRLLGSGSVRERDYTLFWHGKPEDDAREYGVGFAIRNSLLGSITPPSNGSERILAMQLNTTAGLVNLISAYAPTLTSSPDAKDAFYDELSTTISGIPSSQALCILGDFNARVGADHNSWLTCLGHFGVGKMNDNGQRILELCCLHNLCITNTFFNTKPQHRVSWRHPRSKHCHQLDLILIRRSDLSNVKLTRTYHSADCDTDHSLVGCKLKLKPRKIRHTKNEGRVRIDTSKIHDKSKVDAFSKLLQDTLPESHSSNAADRWGCFRDALHNAAISVFGKKTSKTADWFEDNTMMLMPLIDAKRNALTSYKASPSAANLSALRSARNKVKRAARQCTNKYWRNLCSQIQIAADTGDIRGMYEGIKTAIGPTRKKTAPLKSSTGDVIQERDKQMERWVEHYSELYSRETK